MQGIELPRDLRRALPDRVRIRRRRGMREGHNTHADTPVSLALPTPG